MSFRPLAGVNDNLSLLNMAIPATCFRPLAGVNDNMYEVTVIGNLTNEFPSPCGGE